MGVATAWAGCLPCNAGRRERWRGRPIRYPFGYKPYPIGYSQEFPPCVFRSFVST